MLDMSLEHSCKEAWYKVRSLLSRKLVWEVDSIPHLGNIVKQLRKHSVTIQEMSESYLGTQVEAYREVSGNV